MDAQNIEIYAVSRTTHVRALGHCIAGLEFKYKVSFFVRRGKRDNNIHIQYIYIVISIGEGVVNSDKEVDRYVYLAVPTSLFLHLKEWLHRTKARNDLMGKNTIFLKTPCTQKLPNGNNDWGKKQAEKRRFGKMSCGFDGPDTRFSNSIKPCLQFCRFQQLLTCFYILTRQRSIPNLCLFVVLYFWWNFFFI